MNSLGDEIRLLIFVAVQSLVLVAAWRFVSRFINGRLQRLIDTLLLTYLIQYASVGLPGVVGVLSPVSMLLTATVISIGMLVATRSQSVGSALADHRVPVRQGGPYIDSPLIILAGLLFVVGYVAAYAWQLRLLPPMATDALTYHLPAAVQWLQHGRIDLFQTWFFNPANTYSPLAGSMFYAWLLGPIGNDALAHLGAAPMVLLIFLATVAIARSLGASALTAVLAGVAIALSRPIVSQIDKGKDDLFLAAFFAVAVAGLAPKRLRDPLGPWRLGVAIGLCLAIKYTALLALPVLVLAIDAPFKSRWRPRQWVIATACILAIASPWFIRNVTLTGNPLFPTDFLIFNGLLSTSRSLELRTLKGVLGVINDGPFDVPTAMFFSLAITWLTTCVVAGRRAIGEPLTRLCLIGPIAGLGLFVAISPYPEIRFLLPSLILMIAATGVLPRWWGTILVAVISLSAVGSSIDFSEHDVLLTYLLTAVVTGAGLSVAGAALWQLWPRLASGRRGVRVAGLVLVVVVALLCIVFWGSFVDDRRAVADAVRSQDSRGQLWAYVRDQLPRGEMIAYTGTFSVYPLMGDRLDRPIVYVPVRARVESIAGLPRLGDRLTGEQIDPAAVRATIADPNQEQWLARLRRSGARYLVIFSLDVIDSPIEQTWARQHPEVFAREYNGADEVYRITWPTSPAEPGRGP